MAVKNTTRFDAEADYWPYNDRGCGGACVRSLACPYPRCVLDDPGILSRLARERRNREIREARKQGLGVKQIAKRFAVSERTVARALKGAR